MQRVRATISFTILAGLTVMSSPAFAQKVCVPPGYGVPGRSGPPKWVAWDADASVPVNETLIDPRWNGASGQAFGTGAASPPAEFRAVYGTTGTQTYLYLSWTINVADVASTDNHQLYVGFKPPAGDAKILRFRLPAATPTARPAAFTKCNGRDSSATCADTIGANNRPFYALYTASADAASCEDGTNPHWSRFVQDRNMAVHVDWVENTATPAASAASYWVVDATHWAVQLRIPLNTTATDFVNGIVAGTKIWYEIPVDSDGVAARYSFPRPANGIQRFESTNPGQLCHKETVAGAKFEDSFAELATLTPGTPTPGCGGVSLAYHDVGFIHDVALTPGVDFMTANLGNVIKGFRLDGTTPVVNSLFVRPYNGTADTGAPVSIANDQIKARMRIANWGAQQGIAYNEPGWNELPIPGGSRDKPMTGTSPVTPGQKGLIRVDWQLTQPQRCDYGIDTLSSTNWPAVPDPATCERRFSGWDQCILVEMTGGGAFEFANTSIYRNMAFGKMSLFEKPAVIDTAGLPVKRGHKHQDIYLFFSPRNLPTQLPAGTNGLDLIAANATKLGAELVAGFSVEDPDDDDDDGGDVVVFSDDVDSTHGRRAVKPGDFGLQRFVMRRPLAREIDALLPERRQLAGAIYSLPDDLRETVFLLDRIARMPRGEQRPRLTPEALTRELNELFTPALLDSLVPSVDVYVFYDTFEKLQDGFKRVSKLEPMSSFSFHGFLEPGEVVSQLSYAVGNAKQISDNVFRIRIKNGQKSAINFQVQALEAGEEPIEHDEHWNGGGGCGGGAGGGVFIGVGAMVGMGSLRRRRRK